MEQKPSVRHEKEKPKMVCPLPDCGKTYWQEENQLPMCPYHRQLTMDMAWITGNVQLKVEKPKSPLIAAGSAEALDIINKRRTL